MAQTAKTKRIEMMGTVKYRILRPSDLIRYGDERWDFKLGWTKVKDEHLERFSSEYRRAGADAWRFRRPLTVNGQQRKEVSK